MTTQTQELLSMDRIVELLHRRGIEAFVEQTGGGVATIYAGGMLDDGERYRVAAGPGSFAGPGWTDGVALRGDFYAGPDDDGEGASVTITDQSYEEIADLITTEVVASRLRSAR